MVYSIEFEKKSYWPRKGIIVLMSNEVLFKAVTFGFLTQKKKKNVQITIIYIKGKKKKK